MYLRLIIVAVVAGGCGASSAASDAGTDGSEPLSDARASCPGDLAPCPADAGTPPWDGGGKCPGDLAPCPADAGTPPWDGGGKCPGDLQGKCVFEQRSHAKCVSDGPWVEDAVKMVRTQDRLPDLRVRAVLKTEGWYLAGTPSGLFAAADINQVFEPVELGEMAGVRHLEANPLTDEIVVAGDNGVAVVFSNLEMAEYWPAEGAVDQAVDCAPWGLYYLTGGNLWELHRGSGEESEIVLPSDPPVVGIACSGDTAWFATEDRLWVNTDFPELAESWQAPEGEKIVTLAAAENSSADPGAEAGVLVGTTAAVRRILPNGQVKEWMVGPGGLPGGPGDGGGDGAGDGGPGAGDGGGDGGPGAGDGSGDGAGDGGSGRLAWVEGGKGFAVAHAHAVTLARTSPFAVEHFHSLRWLPDPGVNAVAVSGDPFASGPGGVLVGTEGGLALLWKTQSDLRDKADYMLGELEKWGWRLSGFASAQANFPDPWSDGPVVLADDDNDGQWTEEAVAALCYAYAVTGEEKYYESAKKAMENMLLLMDVPAMDFEAAGLGRGFVARSVVRDDEGEVFTSKATQSNWHLVHYTDGHDYYWKDDTSSDETTGHFFGLPLYYDLCAKGANEKAWVAQHVVELAGYILDHGYLLIDLDGQPTEHGYWNPERLAIALDGLDVCVANGHDIVSCADAWGGGGFLNSVEILGAMLAAWHVSGQQRFYDAYEDLVTTHRYGELAMFNKDVVTWTEKGLANYCDHELADLAFLTLIRYEPSPERRAKWVESMLDAYGHEKGERAPLKSLAMAAAVDGVPGLEEGVRTLVEYPRDLRMWLVDSSSRQDYELDVPDRSGADQFTKAPPFDETYVQRWDHNPYRVAEGGDGSARRSPAFWLLPYWGLRYHNALCPPPD